MADKASGRNDYFITIPLDPLGEKDPLLVERYPDHMRYVGLIISAFSECEVKLIGLLALELKIHLNTVADMLYSIESSGARLDAMRAAFAREVTDARRLAEIVELVDEMQSLLTQRNKFAHSIYAEGESGELAMIGMRRDVRVDLPLHDLKHQFGRMKSLSYRIGREIAILAEVFSERPSEQHASDALQKLQSSSPDVRRHPSPQEPPPPSPE